MNAMDIQFGFVLICYPGSTYTVRWDHDVLHAIESIPIGFRLKRSGMADVAAWMCVRVCVCV